MRRLAIGLLVAGLFVGAAPVSAVAELPPGGSFLDDDGSVHEGAIEAIATAGITVGCDMLGERFCPDRVVTRGEMATFLVRALGVEPTEPVRFVDAVGVHRGSIGAAEAEGWFRGCNPPANDRFCPDDALTRAQAAAVLVRAFGLPAGDAGFSDTEGSVFASAVGALAAAGVTRGCDPPLNDRFCPDRGVTRGEMATFLTRLLGLTSETPAPAFQGRIVLGLYSGLVGYAGLAVVEGTRVPRVLIEDTVGDPVLSPDTETIVYVDSRRACPAVAARPDDCYHRIFTIPFAGGDEVQMTPNELRVEGYTWLPDGHAIGFTVEQPGEDWEQTDWYLATVTTPLVVEELSRPPAFALWGAEWSVRGDIVAAAQQEFENTVVLVLDHDGSAKSAIAVAGSDVYTAHWSPDGSRLAHVVSGSDGDELVVSDPDGSGRTVVGAADYIGSVAWSPDGSRLAYEGVFPEIGYSRVLVVSDLHGGQRMLATDIWDFAWSPDSTTIGYIADARAWAVRIDGGGPWPLAPRELVVSNLDWGAAS